MDSTNTILSKLKLNVSEIEKTITMLTTENNRLKTELTEKNSIVSKLNDEMKNLNSVSRIKNQDKQLFEMQKENEFLRTQL